MAAVLSPQPAKAVQTPSPTSILPAPSPSPKPNLTTLPPLVTSPPLKAQTPIQRAPSYSKQRLSTFSTRSNASNAQTYGSRPQSVAFPQFHSTLAYALVRDFAYPPYHPLHYGPPPERESGISTPGSEAPHRRLSDPVPSFTNWSGSRGEWTPTSGGTSTEQLPNTSFGDHDGPPWSEDEDLQSPVVTSSRHRKNKSNVIGFDSRSSRPNSFQNGDGSEVYVADLREDVNTPGGFIQYPPTGTEESSLGIPPTGRRRDSHFATTLPNRSYEAPFEELTSSPESPEDVDDFDVDESRYSRDYQFTIASPDEEMHGRAVALFDFASESENELPLVEGQVILVSYRHGQGWLVAQDPKTGDTGLVPEEYVRLLRDIEGGLHGLLNGQPVPIDHTSEPDTPIDSAEAKTPTQMEHNPHTDFSKRTSHGNNKDGSGEYYAPVVSTFSTSREDFEPWPHHLLGSQVSTPTHASGFPRRNSEDVKDRKSGDARIEEKELHETLQALKMDDIVETGPGEQQKAPTTSHSSGLVPDTMR
jgi:Variant SH3 domain